jgi:starvation-inducible DNA-binding protein
MDRKERPSMVEFLRREQANAVQMYLQYKGYHWNVAGPLFHDLHILFDEHAKQVFETIDDLAERQRILGAPAEYTLQTLRQASNLMAEEKLPPNPKEMVERLVSSHRIVIQDLRKGFELADRTGDPGTADLLTRVVLVHEKLEWFLRELLESPSPVLEGTGLGSVITPRKELSIHAGR